MDERDGRIGYWISGGAHIALILWALLGGVFFRPQPSMPVRTTEVATMSGAEFEEYAAASRGAGPVRDEATSAADLPEPETEDDAAAPPEQTTAPETEPAQELAEPDAPEVAPDLSEVEQQPPAANVTTELPGSPETPDEAEPTPDAPSETQPPQASEPTRPVTSPRPQDRPAELVERYNQQVAEEAARLAAEAERAEAAQQAEAAAEAEREAAEQREADERAAQAEAERREAEAQQKAEEQRRQEEARRAAQEQQAEQERRAAEEQAAREEEERRQAEEERRRADEAARAEAEQQAAEEARREEERRATAERERQELEAREREGREQAERERAEREAAERADQEAADQRALEEALREAQQSGAEGQDTATTGESVGGNRQRIEGGSGASATQEPLAAALENALGGASATADDTDIGVEPTPDSLLEPVPITPTPLPDPDEQSSLDTENGGAAPLGQPLSLAERDGLRMAMQDCWNRGALSVEASRVSVSIEFRMLPDARPDIASLRLIDSSTKGSQTAIQNAYETARRAILQCGRAGYPLPAEKYGRWRTVIVDFRPDGINFE